MRKLFTPLILFDEFTNTKSYRLDTTYQLYQFVTKVLKINKTVPM